MAAIPYSFELFYEPRLICGVPSCSYSLTGKKAPCFEFDGEIAVSDELIDGEVAQSVDSFTSNGGFEFSPSSLPLWTREVFAAAKKLLEADAEFLRRAYGAVESNYRWTGKGPLDPEGKMVEAA